MVPGVFMVRWKGLSISLPMRATVYAEWIGILDAGHEDVALVLVTVDHAVTVQESRFIDICHNGSALMPSGEDG